MTPTSTKDDREDYEKYKKHKLHTIMICDDDASMVLYCLRCREVVERWQKPR